jgi:adenine-specific DNA-methyltransferase
MGKFSSYVEAKFPLQEGGGILRIISIKGECLRKFLSKFQTKLKGKEEVEDLLLDFFSAFLSPSGTPFLFRSRLSSGVYLGPGETKGETQLWWRTMGLIYVGSRKYLPLRVEVNSRVFAFDVSDLPQGVKIKLGYILQGVKGREVSLKVVRGERGSDLEAIATEASIPVEDLRRAVSVFESQRKEDFFLAQNLRTFMKNQLNLWIAERIGSVDLQVLEEFKVLASEFIDFLSSLEEELVKVWRKPRFARRVNYVVSLDRLRSMGLDKLISEGEGAELQRREWEELGVMDSETRPVDTKYFPGLKERVEAALNHLDQELDGWLIRAENLEALNTLRRKFMGRVQTVYIDPPFNKEGEADFMYSVNFKDSSWITMMENRLSVAREILKEDGSIFVRCDHNGDAYLRLLMDRIFGRENFRNEIVVSRTTEFYKNASGLKRLMVDFDTILYYSKGSEPKFRELREIRDEVKWLYPFLPGEPKDEEDRYREVMGRRVAAPPGRKWGLTQEQVRELEELGLIRFKGGKVVYSPALKTLKNNWTDIPGYSRGWGFKTENSEVLLHRVLSISTDPGDLVVDFFLGSGTTIAVAQKMGRKWIGVEQGEHSSLALLRMKEVLAGKGRVEPYGITKQVEWKGGGFFKYYELESLYDFVDDLRYSPSCLEGVPFLLDLKLLVHVESPGMILVKPYDDVDLPESASLSRGSYISQVREGVVRLEDGTEFSLDRPPAEVFKEMLWWK